jgi:endonuclease/exonuclease/phosphatase family metal-dependent hydrolase
VIRALSWNLFHGRDHPPDPRLLTWRSRLFRITERNETHLQVNRSLYPEFKTILAAAEWDVALLQECRPRWVGRLAEDCDADAHVSLTSRNSLPPLRALLAWLNPDLIASNEGGSNVTLVRGGSIAERRELTLTFRPERRTMAFTRLASGLCVANLHASTADPAAASELLRAADLSIAWAGDAPLILGGDFNIRPDRSPESYAELRGRGFREPHDPSAIDHLLARGLDVTEPPVSWPPECREVREDGRAIRLSDHAPVSAVFA